MSSFPPSPSLSLHSNTRRIPYNPDIPEALSSRAAPSQLSPPRRTRTCSSSPHCSGFNNKEQAIAGEFISLAGVWVRLKKSNSWDVSQAQYRKELLLYRREYHAGNRVGVWPKNRSDPPLACPNLASSTTAWAFATPSYSATGSGTTVIEGIYPRVPANAGETDETLSPRCMTGYASSTGCAGSSPSSRPPRGRRKTGE